MIKQSALLGSQEAVSLGCQPGRYECTPIYDRFFGRRPSVALFQRGTASDNILKWTVLHHCLATLSVAMHTSQLGLRIQGRPLPEHHQLTRHTSYVCGGVVDGIQLRIPQCEEDNLEALGEFIATAAVVHLTEKPLGEN